MYAAITMLTDFTQTTFPVLLPMPQQPLLLLVILTPSIPVS
jgi:hypothetical protein